MPACHAAPLPSSPRRLLQVDMTALAAQVPNMTLINEVQGVEDPRTFVHNGAPYLLVTLHLLGEETPQQRLARGRKRVVSGEAAAESAGHLMLSVSVLHAHVRGHVELRANQGGHARRVLPCRVVTWLQRVLTSALAALTLHFTVERCWHATLQLHGCAPPQPGAGRRGERGGAALRGAAQHGVLAVKNASGVHSLHSCVQGASLKRVSLRAFPGRLLPSQAVQPTGTHFPSHSAADEELHAAPVGQQRAVHGH